MAPGAHGGTDGAQGPMPLFEQERTKEKTIEVPENQPPRAAGGAEEDVDVRSPPAVFGNVGRGRGAQGDVEGAVLHGLSLPARPGGASLRTWEGVCPVHVR